MIEILMKISNSITDSEIGLISRPRLGSRLGVLINSLRHDELKLKALKIIDKLEVYEEEHNRVVRELEHHESAIEVRLMQMK